MGVAGNGGVEQGDGDAVELDPLVAPYASCPAMQSWLPRTANSRSPNGRAVAVLEGGELRSAPSAVRSPLAITAANGSSIVGGDELGDGRPVHHVGIGRLAGSTPQDRPELAVTDATGLGLAEVDVVDRGEPTTQPPAGSGSVE